MAAFSVEIKASAFGRQATVFALGGHLDAVTVSQLEGRFKETMEAGQYHWVVDLSQLDYISSAGLGAFIGVLEEVRSHGGDIFFVGLSPKLQKIFQVLGFLRIFRIFAAEEEAVREFGLP